MRLEIVGVFLQNVLHRNHGFTHAAEFEVQFRESAIQVLRLRVVIKRQLIFLNCLIREVGPSILRGGILVEMREAIVVIRAASVVLCGGVNRAGGFRERWGTLRKCGCGQRDQQDSRSERKKLHDREILRATTGSAETENSIQSATRFDALRRKKTRPQNQTPA